MSKRAPEVKEGMTQREIDLYIPDAIQRFQRENAGRGLNAFPVAVLVKGLVKKTGLFEDEIKKRLMERGVDLTTKMGSPAERKIKRPVSSKKLERFLKELEAGPDKSGEPLDFKQGTRGTDIRF